MLRTDTAQSYSNETQAGQALREAGLPRGSVWITTKFSGQKSVEDSIKDSLDYVRLLFYFVFCFSKSEKCNCLFSWASDRLIFI